MRNVTGLCPPAKSLFWSVQPGFLGIIGRTNKIFLSLAFATSLFVLARSKTTLTGPYTCLTQGNYKLCNDQWGIASGTGNQTATLISTSGNDISWSTTWTWADNENSVKSYTDVESITAKGMLLCDITTAPTVWDWEYTTQSSGIRADVAYDIWIGTTPDGSLQTSGVSIAGYTWNVWKGPNSNWETISFVSQDGNINSFNADLNEFFTWLIDNEGVSSSLYLQAIESGIEAFIGSAELLTSCYSVSVTTAWAS